MAINRESFDVIVIGGGPSGLFTSALLSASGINTVLIEKESEIGKDIVCSGVISKEAFERYDLPENTIVGRLKEAELFSPGGVHIPYSHPEEAVVLWTDISLTQSSEKPQLKMAPISFWELKFHLFW